MDEAGLLRASERERALYDELGAAYRALAAALADEAAPVDPETVTAHQQRVEATVEALRSISAAVTPHRLSGAPVAADVASLWRASAGLAAAALEANRKLGALARARQAALAARLAQLDEGRRALAGYRPSVAPVRAAAQRA
ncbi:MAG TPA: hypothetical protein VEM57_02295 [Candidatus Binatus sp.]|nr:hypothetical protein [Candidatus Binatus sp.]